VGGLVFPICLISRRSASFPVATSSIKEALRQAALQWVQEKSGINPDDPIFHLKPVVFRDKKGRIDKRASVDIDKIVYGEELSRNR